MIRASVCTDPSLRTQSAQSMVARRLLLRTLSCYLGLADADIPLAVARSGRPVLAAPLALQVSLSHCPGAVVAAVADHRIGVDVEQIRPPDGYAASRMLQPGELADIAAAADPVRELFRYWTIKESYLKAIGLGLRYPPQRLRVTNGRDPAAPHLDRPGARLRLAEQFDSLVIAICCLHAEPDDDSAVEKVDLDELGGG